jgi:hypothetical protein
MKKLLIIITVLIVSFNCKGQFYAGLGVGTSTKAPIGELQIGVESYQLQVQTGFYCHLNNKVSDGATFYGKASPVIHISNFKLMPGIGYAYNVRSTDRKELNSKGLLLSIYGYKEVYNGDLFVGATYTDKTLFISIGLRAVF